MVEDEAADIGGGGDLAALARQRVISGDVAQPLGGAQARLRLHGAMNKAFMDQNIGPARRLDESGAECRVAAEDETPPGSGEDEAKGMADREMVDRHARRREIAELEDLG